MRKLLPAGAAHEVEVYGAGDFAAFPNPPGKAVSA